MRVTKAQLLFLVSCISVYVLFSTHAFASLEKEYPQRIISLSPDITEELYLLGAESKLVGCTVYCQRPPEAKKKEKVGTILEVSVEKILALKPDLVLAVSLTSPILREKLTNLGMRVVTFPSPKNFQEICEQFLELGRMIGKVQKAEEIIRPISKKIDSIINQVKSLRKPRVFVQIGTKPLATINKDSFINDFIEKAGGINSTKDLNNILYSRERIIKDNPEVIIVASMGINGKQEIERWKKFNTLQAVRNDRIYSVDSELLCSPTPVSFAETLEKIVTLLHPENE
ncbi:MAG: ABC transporter substrate-binding protein [bacterium]